MQFYIFMDATKEIDGKILTFLCNVAICTPRFSIITLKIFVLIHVNNLTSVIKKHTQECTTKY